MKVRLKRTWMSQVAGEIRKVDLDIVDALC